MSKQNVIQYVHLVAHQLLNVQGQLQVKAFLRGFRDLIPASWVRLFSSYELQKLIGGDDSVKGIDVASLKGAMQYAAGYHPSQPVVQVRNIVVLAILSADMCVSLLHCTVVLGDCGRFVT